MRLTSTLFPEQPVKNVAWAFCQYCSARHLRRSFNVEPQARTSVAELAMNHRDIAAPLGLVSKAPPCPNFRLRLNVKRLCVIKLRSASSGKNRAEHYWHPAHDCSQ